MVPAIKQIEQTKNPKVGLFDVLLDQNQIIVDLFFAVQVVMAILLFQNKEERCAITILLKC